MGISVAFWLLAAIIVIAALGVVLLSNLFRAALLLVLCFLGVAGMYVLLNADFLAVVQILIYAGAISILLIFAILITPQVYRGNPFGRFRLPALFISGLMLAAFILVTLGTHWPTPAAAPGAALGGSTILPLSPALFGRGGALLPLEIAAMLLLAILVGAIALLKEKRNDRA